MTVPPGACDQTSLKRSLSLPMLTLYGLGTTIGAGIYVLIGKTAGIAGMHAPISFLVAALLAGLTVLSFAEFSARLPKSAGEAVYVHAAFPVDFLALAVGLAVMFAGLISSAAISHGFVGYLHEFVDAPDWLAIVLLVGALGAVAAWGITESTTVAVAATVIEIGGLCVAIWSGHENLADIPARLPELLPPLDMASWGGILAASILAFYAFIGFEDMVNVAEEVKDAERTLPRAVILTLVISTAFYLVLALVAVLSLPLDELANSEAPITALIERRTPGLSGAISVVAIIAVLNGALVQIVMASRVLYGLASQGWLPRVLTRVHPRTQTPVLATVIVVAVVLAFALWLPLVRLAEITSFLMLGIFALVNLALWQVKRHDPRPEGTFRVPIWVPAAGFLACAGVIVTRLLSGIAG